MESFDTIISDTLSKIDFHKINKHPNILIAARFWEDDRYNAALTIYKFMRRIDDMIDDRKTLGEVLSCMEKKMFSDKVHTWIDCLDEENQADPLFAGVTGTIRRFHIPLNAFYAFARSMVYDINHDGFKTFDDFLQYAEGASNGPASVFVHLCCLEKRGDNYTAPCLDISAIARPCAIFSYLVHIIRDFQKDQLSNLNYFAMDILEKHGLTAKDLRHIAEGAKIPVGFRNVIREYKEIAGRFKTETEKVLLQLEDMLELRYYMSLRIIFELYLEIYNRIDPERGTFTTGELNPAPEEIQQSVMKFTRAFKESLLA